ncbi:DUF6082 family protein [Nonomuraea sp. NPDC049655]|uniref:DUF6082 family protein n=1 Tax=Nonomuraea sp. NPDC049655 TaxID=3364355 RepID=UPI0037B87EE9
MNRRSFGRYWVTILLLLSVVAAAGLVVASPFFLAALGRSRGDWSVLGDIGQTYGAASAILAVLALIGVAFSLVLQAREAKSAREQALRTLHGDLMKMAMDDPLYRACWGAFFASGDEEGQRAHLYVNMILNHWLLMWELRSITEAHLREIAATVLAGPIGRDFWRQARTLRTTSAGSRRERRFNLIIDDVYSEVTAGGAAPVAAQAARGGSSVVVGVGVALALVVVVRRILRGFVKGGR